MTVLNDLDRYHLAMDAVKRCDLGEKGREAIKLWQQKLADHSAYIREYGEDTPDVLNWRWTSG